MPFFDAWGEAIERHRWMIVTAPFFLVSFLAFVFVSAGLSAVTELFRWGGE